MSTKKTSYIILFVGLLLTGLFSCANRSMGPQGGPKDVTPPKYLKSKPANAQLNVKTNELELEFNEFIALDKPGEKIIISPPQVLPPTIRTAGKKVLVTLNDSLLPNTTYSVDFTNAIIDITERNALNGFTYSFSTGNTIDSLQIAGVVLDAQNLNPLSNMIVGIYDNLHDTAFVKTAPLRVARTDDTGWFSIKSVKAGSYHIFALNDLNRDFTYNDPNEQLAFQDALVIPSSKTIEVLDTTKIDTTKTDSVARKKIKTVYLPDSLVLLAFKQKAYKQYITKSERKEPYKLTFYFNAPNQKIPVFKPLNFKPSSQDFYQLNTTVDTISYWIADSSVWQQDTLKLSIAYGKSDSIGNPITQLDTLELAYKKPVQNKKNIAAALANKILAVSHNIKGELDIYKPIIFSFTLPILTADTNKIHLYYKKDSLWVELPIKLTKTDSLGFSYGFSHIWNSELFYKLEYDSAAFISKYGTVCMKNSIPFKVKGLDQYANLIINLLSYDSLAVIEVLNPKDGVVRRLAASEQGTEFEYLIPGDYYIRLFIDSNNNGQWDAGKYADKKQAEQVYYLNQKLSLRANWDVEQEWDLKAAPLTKQKPAELQKKNK